MCIHADPLESSIVAVIVPDPKALQVLRTEYGIPKHDFSHPKLLQVVGKDLLACAERGDFKGAEVLKSFTLLEDEWTPENGMLTAAQKIKRKEIVASYQHIIQKMYSKKK